MSRRRKDGKSGPEIVLEIIARLLNPEVDESSALCIGGVVSATVDKVCSNSYFLLNSS